MLTVLLLLLLHLLAGAPGAFCKGEEVTELRSHHMHRCKPDAGQHWCVTLLGTSDLPFGLISQWCVLGRALMVTPTSGACFSGSILGCGRQGVLLRQHSWDVYHTC
jgi:hypothetical protein